VQGASFLRSDANDSFSGTLSGSGSINITGNVTATNFTGNGSGLTGVTATNADTLDGLDSLQFLRSDVEDSFTSGVLRFTNGMTAWSTTTPGATVGNIHIGTVSGVTNAGGAITFGARDASSGANAQAGIYINSDGSYGTRMYFATTNSYATASQVAGHFNESKNFFVRGEITAFSSDRRLKTDIENIPNALDKVLALNGVLYRWKEEAIKHGLIVDTDKLEVGLLAQEVQAVLPEAVAPAPFDQELGEDGKEYSKSGENYLTVKYERIAPVLIEAIKEQQAQIESQAAEIAELRAMVQKILDK
jgi:hypothetical protein